MTDEKKQEETLEDITDSIVPGMGNLVKRLRSLSPEFDEKASATTEEIRKRLKEGASPTPEVSYGIRVRPLVQQERTSRPAGAVNRIEPQYDLFDENEQMRVIVELPGVDEDDITVVADGKNLRLEAVSGERRYGTTILLPGPARILEQRFSNGLLEVILVNHDDRDR